MKEVVVLMSTYNGQLYLREQIDSILMQEDVKVRLIVRDDGSKDSTKLILQEYSEANKLNWYTGDNLRSAKSFMQLLCDAPECEYYAFADQDDIWHTDKLKKSLSMIEKNTQHHSDEMILCFCNKNVVDSNNNFIECSHYNYIQRTEKVFLEFFASGCCMVFNNKLRQFVLSHNPTSWYMLHDQWIYLLASIWGKVLYDDTPHMNYRIHSNNVAGKNTKSSWQRFKSLFYGENSNKWIHVSDLASEILKVCNSELSKRDFEVLSTISHSKYSIITRLKMAVSSDYTISRHSLKAKLYYKIKLLMNKM